MGLLGNIEATSMYNSYREGLTDVYFKIEGVFVDTQLSKVRVQVRGWLSEYARWNQGLGIFKRVFYIPVTEFATVLCTPDDLATKAYEYIKTLPEFAGAEDSLGEYDGVIDVTEELAEEQEKTLEELIADLRVEVGDEDPE